MSEPSQNPEQAYTAPSPAYPPPPAPGQAPPSYPGSPLGGQGYGAPAGYGANRGPLGKRENIGLQILLSIVTLGLYGFYWVYKCHEEIKQHSGEGVGGVIGVIIYFFVGIVTLFLLPLEIKRMYEREGLPSPVGAATAFWVLLFVIPWYVKCQRALNKYWEMKGVPA